MDIKTIKAETEVIKNQFLASVAQIKEVKADCKESKANVDDICCRLDNLAYSINYISNSINELYRYVNSVENHLYKHLDNGHIPPILGAEKFANALEALGIDGDYKVEKKTIWASQNHRGLSVKI